MKKSILIIAFLFSLTIGTAQTALQKGTILLNAGSGITNYGLPLYTSLDVAIARDVTLGGEVYFRLDPRYDIDMIYAGLGIAANANYHFNSLLKFNDKFDLYAGASVGYIAWASHDLQQHHYSVYTGYYDRKPAFNMLIQTGGRYFFSKKIGINMEVCVGSFLATKIGITWKLR